MKDCPPALAVLEMSNQEPNCDVDAGGSIPAPWVVVFKLQMLLHL